MRIVQIVKNSLNGDADKVDPAVRRTLYALAQELDEQSQDWDARIKGLTSHIDSSVASLRSEMDAVRRLLISLTGTVIVGIIVGIVNVAVTF